MFADCSVHIFCHKIEMLYWICERSQAVLSSHGLRLIRALSIIWYLALSTFFHILINEIELNFDRDDSWEEEIQIYINEVDPVWGGANRCLLYQMSNTDSCEQYDAHVSNTDSCEQYQPMWAIQTHVSSTGPYKQYRLMWVVWGPCEQYRLVWAVQTHVSNTDSFEQNRLMRAIQSHVSNRLMWAILMWTIQTHESNTDSCEQYRLMRAVWDPCEGPCELYSYQQYRLMWAIHSCEQYRLMWAVWDPCEGYEAHVS